MRIAANLLALGPAAGGVGRYARELYAELLSVDPGVELELFAPADAPEWVRELAGADRARLTRLRVRSDRPPQLYPAQLVALGDLAERRRCDLVHGPATFVPWTGRTPVVSTIHDVMWIEHPALSGFSRGAALVWRALSMAAAWRATAVLTDTQAAADDLHRLLRVPRHKLDVVLLGAETASRTAPTSPDEVRRRFDLGDARVVLSVGQKRPHKNLETAIRALALLDEDVLLVAPGADAGHGDHLRDLATELGVGERVRLPDWVSDADLEGLYAVASVAAQLSLLEGFGLPAIEAMQRGVPAVVSDTPALVEAAGGAAVVVPATDHAAAAAALRRVLADDHEAAALRERGRRRVDELTWRRTATETLAVFRRALSASR